MRYAVLNCKTTASGEPAILEQYENATVVLGSTASMRCRDQNRLS